MIEQQKPRPLNKPLFDLQRESMSKSEQIRFQAMRQSGSLTFFDCHACEACGAEIPLVKRYCSQACESKARKGDPDA